MTPLLVDGNALLHRL